MGGPGLRKLLRNPRLLVPLALAVAAGLGALLVWVIGGNTGFSYDEQSHRRVIEATFGEDYVEDWPTYRDVWMDVCEAESLSLTAAVFVDGGTTPAEFALNVEYVCPDRREELPPGYRILG